MNVSKGSVGLGLATRSVSAPSLQKHNKGKSLFAYMALSLFLMVFGVVAPHFSNNLKHTIIEKTAFLNEAVSVPLDYATTTLGKIQAIWDVQKTNEQLAAENQRLMEWYMTANRLDSENKALRELLNMESEEALSFK